MIMKAFRYRLEPTKHQTKLFEQSAGSCRFIYNMCLEYIIESLDKKIRRSYPDLCKYLTQLKGNSSYSWLSDAPSQALQQSIKNLCYGLTRYYKGDKNGNTHKFPRFKKRGYNDSFRYPQGFKVEDDKIFCPKVGWVRFRNSRSYEGTIKHITIKRELNHWFVILTCSIDREPVQQRPRTVTGIDVGITTLAVLSNGETIENPRHLKKDLEKLKREQKKLSRKMKRSNRRHKQRNKVAKIHVTIKNKRKDSLHNATTHLVKSHDAFAVESLTIKNMVKNHRLAQAILDASWGEFLRMLEYKCTWAGKELVKLARFLPTSQLCSSCNARQKMPLHLRTYHCKKCGLAIDRDLNASLIIQAAGQADLQARGAIGCEA